MRAISTTNILSINLKYNSNYERTFKFIISHENTNYFRSQFLNLMLFIKLCTSSNGLILEFNSFFRPFFIDLTLFSNKISNSINISISLKRLNLFNKFFKFWSLRFDKTLTNRILFNIRNAFRFKDRKNVKIVFERVIVENKMNY